MSAELDETALIDAARAGSVEAFGDLVRLHQAPVRACLARFVRTWEAVDDLAQDTFLRAFKSLPSYRAEAPFRLWILAIARNRAVQHLAEAARRRTRPLDAAVDAWMAEEAQADRPELSGLRACLEKLPEHASALVNDFYFRRRTAVDIARESGRTESAVWMALLRLRQALRRCVESRLGVAHE